MGSEEIGGIGTTRAATLATEVFPAADPLRSLSPLPGAFALRSSLPDAGSPARRARWSFFGADPFASFRGDMAGPRALWRELAAGVHAPELARELASPPAARVGYWRTTMPAGRAAARPGATTALDSCSRSTTW
jgi:hypothetical protein